MRVRALVGAVVVGLLVYHAVWYGDFLWDDAGHVVPVALRDWGGLLRLWTEPSLSQQYYPVTTTVFWTIGRIWGDWTLPYHLTSISLHGLSAGLFVVLLHRLRVPGAWLAGALFLLHPMHVESVAWISEIKNTLSACCMLAAALAYLRFDGTRARRAYITAAAWFLLALGSKTVTATLPPALLVVMWWRRGGLEWRRDVVPLLPLLCVGVAAGIGTAWLEVHQIGARGDEYALGILDRVLLAGRISWFYAMTLLWPSPLMFNYPRWVVDSGVWWQWLFPLAAALVVGVAWWWRSRDRGPLACVLLFGGLLFPALGFINVYPFRYSWVADHFAYHASLPFLAGMCAAVVMAMRRWWPQHSMLLPAVVLLVPAGVLTMAQSRHYVDAPTLYTHTLAQNPSSTLALTNLAALWLDDPQADLIAATALAERAVRLSPDNAVAQNLLGLSRLKAGILEAALEAFDRSIALDARMPQGHYNRGLALDGLGRLVEAAEAYEAARQLSPDSPEVLHNLAGVLRRVDRADEALVHLTRAASLSPSSPEILMNLADTLMALSRLEDAVRTYERALALRPLSGEGWNNFGVALRQAGRLDDAVAAFRTAVRVLPQAPLVHLNLASALDASGRRDEAIGVLEAARAALPGSPAIEQALISRR